jgi:hypothetical protein
MRRVILSLAGALLAVAAMTTSASAAPIDVKAEPGDGGVTVTVTIQETYSETIKTGQLAIDQDPTKESNGPGLCASGDIHNSCTPANEASNN